jgi:hypothetical protein
MGTLGGVDTVNLAPHDAQRVTYQRVLMSRREIALGSNLVFQDGDKSSN